MEPAERIRNIVARLKLTPVALADLLGVDRSIVTRYLDGSRSPGPLPCLSLAALSDNPKDRDFWIARSGVTRHQMELLAKAVGAPAPTGIDGTEAKLLEWWRDPQGPIAESVRDVVAELLRPEDEEEGE